jgi:hypothetical protein
MTKASFVSTGLACSWARSGWIAVARFQSGWELECVFVSGRTGTKTGPEPKLASLSRSPRPGTEPDLLPSESVPAAGSLSPRPEHATTQQRRRRGGSRRPRGGARWRRPYVPPFLVLLAGDSLALPFVLVLSPSSRVLGSWMASTMV